MEVVTSLSTNINGANGGTKKHIQEWSRLDKLTGMREHARVEADHWASNTSNSRHHFGKVVDSRARNLADGSVQQKQQTKQLEVFQAHIPGGSVQVIRSHTSTTSSWHNSKVLQSPSSTWTSSNSTDNLLKRRIGDMEVEIDSLKFDHNPVNLESEKAKANIARHLTNRRPPTRSKISKINNNDTPFTNLPITYDFSDENKDETNHDIDKITDSKLLSFSSSRNSLSQTLAESGREKLDKKKSISDENLSFNSHLDDGNVEEKVTSSPWMRSCRTRWSFQHPTSSRYKEKIETAEKNKSELENVLKKFLRNKPDFESYSKNLPTVEIQKPKPLHKKSFVTEATLQETKRKLRHLSKDRVGDRKNSPEEVDDGIFTESKCNSDKEDEKAVTHEDLENALNKNPSPKCLEFRAINKSDDWFDRRKSYGFEPVRQPNISSSLNSTPKTNSSTDSGICRSSELELASTSIVKKVTEAKEERMHSTNDDDTKSGEIFGTNEVPELMRKFEKLDKSKVGATVITFKEVPKIKVLDSSDSQRDIIKKGRVFEAIKNFERNGINCKTLEPTSLTKVGSYYLEELNQKQNQLTTDQDFLAKRHSIACDDTKYMTSTFKIPESSFPEKISLPGKTTVVNVNNYESSNSPLPFADADAKKPKKVEFSKTEVHFAATEPGKIRIVETDEKPPPTNLYRKKKRSVSVSPKSDLPQTKFGVYNNFTDPENSPDKKSTDMGFRSQFTSTVSDNGLAVTISSTRPTDYRRASWSVIEDLNSSPIPLENKPAYSTKINFGREGVTVVADSKSPQHEKIARESRVSSTKTTNKTKYPDEISEKSHFKPLKNNEDELKIIGNVVEVKKPKIASVVMKLDGDKQRDGNSAGNSRKSTVILNKSPKMETAANDTTTKEINDHANATRNLHQTTNTNSVSSKTNDYVNVADLKEAKQLNISTKSYIEEIFKKETESAKIIYHNIELSDKSVQNENEKKSYLSRRGSERDMANHRKKIDSRESVVSHGSIRRSAKSTNSKEKLPDSGRDGWLNLPKERKALSEKKTIENGKHEIYRKPHIDHVKKDKRTKSGINGYGDISSEEDSTKRSGGKIYIPIPLSTIPEKSKVNRTSKLPVTKMASNSSTETRSNSIEFKNPVLKTEERSRRRAARMLQRASSREMLMNSNVASSSDDVTSENEIHYSKSSKPRNTRKLKSSPKTVKPVTTTSNLPPKKTVTSSAQMQINIFNIKDRTNSERRSGHAYNTSSRSSNCIDVSKSSKSRPHAGQRELHASIPEKSRPKQVSSSSRDTRNMSTSTTKSTRPLR